MSESPWLPDVKITCVLGMHRSGTSLVTRILNLLGDFLGPEDHLLEPNIFNPKGYWEHQAIVDLNDEILSRLGGSWHSVPSFRPGWESSSELAETWQRARAVLHADFTAARAWAWKDPRTCLTLPFWQRLLPPMRYVFCLRNPVDVARSLECRSACSGQPRNGLSFEKGVSLWLTYVTSALNHTRRRPRHLFFYEDFLVNWRQGLKRLATFLGRDGALDQAMAEAVRGIIDEELHHHRTSFVDALDEPRLSYPPKALYMALRLYCEQRTVTEDDSRAERVLEGLDVFGSHSLEAQAEEESLGSLLEKQGKQLGEREQALQVLQGRLAGLQADMDARDRTIRALEAKVAAMQAHLDEAQQERQALSARLEEVTGYDKKFRATLVDMLDQLLRRSRVLETALREQGATRAGTPPQLASVGGPSQQLAYPQLVARLREFVHTMLPPGATVIVVSKGDNELLKLEGRKAWHFPQREDGAYAGFYPADSAAAIAHLEALRIKGGQFLLFPSTALWWLEYYKEFNQYLESRYRVMARHETCLMFALDKADGEAVRKAPQKRDFRYQQLTGQIRAVVDSVLPVSATVVVVSKGDDDLLKLGGRKAWHFPRAADGSYAGYYPGDSAAAISHLEALRDNGAEFLLLPHTAFWWLDHYKELRRHLERNSRLVVRQNHVCVIFGLAGSGVRPSSAPEPRTVNSSVIGG